MFTGIITDIGTIRAVEARGDVRVTVGTAYDTATVDLLRHLLMRLDDEQVRLLVLATSRADPTARAADGVARLDQDAQDGFGFNYMNVVWEADRVTLLRGIEHTKFFKTLRADLVVSLYNQPEIWPKFGYEGSSAEYGGYLARGFNDIDWLPTV